MTDTPTLATGAEAAFVEALGARGITAQAGEAEVRAALPDGELVVPVAAGGEPADAVLRLLEERALLPAAGEAYSSDEEAEVAARLESLGYM